MNGKNGIGCDANVWIISLITQNIGSKSEEFIDFSISGVIIIFDETLLNVRLDIFGEVSPQNETNYGRHLR